MKAGRMERQMGNSLERTEILLGGDAVEGLGHKTVAVFGIGGVGGFAVEALARTGIGTLHLIDRDTVSETNLNRQIIALHSTVGRYKTEVMRERVLDINPLARVHVHNCFFLPENADEFDFADYDYVVDAVDTVAAKLEIVMRAKQAGVPVISCMGAGNKLDPAAFRVADLYETSVCPLAKVMRRELKKRGVHELKVVYSQEKPVAGAETAGQDSGEKTGGQTTGRNDGEKTGDGAHGRRTVGSVAYVPSVAGLIMAGEVIRDLVAIP